MYMTSKHSKCIEKNEIKIVYPSVRLDLLNHLLPPANEVCEGYVFTGVCHSVHRGRACVVASGGRGMHGCSLGGMCGCSGGVCMVALGGGCGFFDEIRSMSGRYASYWNAFLFSEMLLLLKLCFRGYCFDTRASYFTSTTELHI